MFTLLKIHTHIYIYIYIIGINSLLILETIDMSCDLTNYAMG